MLGSILGMTDAMAVLAAHFGNLAFVSHNMLSQMRSQPEADRRSQLFQLVIGYPQGSGEEYALIIVTWQPVGVRRAALKAEELDALDFSGTTAAAGGGEVASAGIQFGVNEVSGGAKINLADHLKPIP